MKNGWKWLLAPALVLGLLAACETQPATEEGTTTEETAADATAAVENLATQLATAVSTQDVSIVESIYAEDIVELPPNQPMREGKQASVDEMKKNIDESMMSEEDLQLTPDNTVVAESGDIAYQTGSYTYHGTTAEGMEIDDSGKYMLASRNEAGEWKLTALSWSSDTSVQELAQAMEGMSESAPGDTTEDEGGAMEDEGGAMEDEGGAMEGDPDAGS